MRRQFHPLLLDFMRKDTRIHVVTADLGFGMFDAIRDEFPARFTNCGAAEQLLLGIGVGLAYKGKIPVLHSITPFLLFRGAEWIRNYVNHEKTLCRLLASGRDSDYHEDGFTHFAGDDKTFLSMFPNISCYWPENVAELASTTEKWLYDSKPSYLNLKR